MAAELIGRCRCPVCKSDRARLSLAKSRLSVITCNGCNFQGFARSDKADELLRARLVIEAPPVPAAPPAPVRTESAPPPAPPKAPEPVRTAPTPEPAAAAPVRAPAPAPTEPPRRAAWGLDAFR